MKILLIGNNSKDTDNLATFIAKKNKTVNYGLLNDSNTILNNNGYYHTSLIDLSPGEIIQKIAPQCDLIELLDQDISSYSSYKIFVTTLRLLYDLEALNFNVNYRDKKTAADFLYWKEFLKQNKSFCFYPYAAFVEKNNGAMQLCPKNNYDIKKFLDISNWQNDPDLNKIRSEMEQGIPMKDELCLPCKIEEKLGDESARQFETLEWALRLGMKTYTDFRKVKNPAYYEVRPSNKCNIKCRTCSDGFSHLIAKEFKTLKFPLSTWHFDSMNIDQINLQDIKSIYFGGGEPTIMPEFYKFLKKCIKLQYTKFDINIGTNGYKISETLLKLLDNFSNVCFAFSFDGYGEINNYIRWGSNFEQQVYNSRMIRDRGHKISLQTVFSIYNLTRLHEIYEFYDNEFRNTGLLVNLAGSETWQEFHPLNHPLPDQVIESLQKCQQTKTYFSNGRSAKSNVDSLLRHYSDPAYNCNLESLKIFYEFNDKLDSSRNSRLQDYIPELANARHKFNL